MKYPKIHSLFKREEQKPRRLIEGEYSKEEFANIKHFLVTEKIDGMNIRIHGVKVQDAWEVGFAGRTDAAMLPPKLLSYLQSHFGHELFNEVFNEAHEVLLFGEGYGEKIQSGGYYYPEQRFVLFDVLIDRNWWMEWTTIMEIANSFDIPNAPGLPSPRTTLTWTQEEIIEYVKSKPNSLFADDKHVTEGVVARAYPMMLFRDGTPIKFKLKVRDFIN